MEEMNADNQKVDAAVAAVPYVKLLDVTTETDAAQVELDLSGIDLSPYVKLELIALPHITFTDTSAQIYVKLNGGASCINRPEMSSTSTTWYNYAASFYASTQAGYNGIFKMVLTGLFMPPAGETQNAVILSNFSANYSKGRSWQIEWSHWISFLAALNSVSFVPTDATTKLAAGSKFVLFGVRA